MDIIQIIKDNMYKLAIIIFSFLLYQSCSSQASIQTEPSSCRIGKDRALQIAFENGFEKGLDTITATKLNDSIWTFECLVCDDDYTDRYDNISINCHTGKRDSSVCIGRMTSYVPIGGTPRVYAEFALVMDNKPVLKTETQPFKLTDFESGEESHVSISGKNVIAFSYGFRNIGIINVDGSGFKQIAGESLYPRWVNNEVIAYFKDFEHVYEYNVNTLKETRITSEAYAYYDFSVSPDNKWLAWLKDAPHVEYDSNGNPVPGVQTCTSPREYDLWIMNISNPAIKKKINGEGADIYDLVWTQNGDSLLFYIGDSKYFATGLEKNSITCSKLERLQDIKLTNYEKIRNGLFPVIKDCKIVSADYSKRSVKDILVNERGRYNECVFSNDQRYLIYTKRETKAGDTKIRVLNLTK